MSSQYSQAEDAIFQTMLPQLEAEGFQVFIHPPRKMLPAFLETFQLDAVAYKGDRKIAIEVMIGSLGRDSKVRRLREVFAEHPDWELRFIYAPPRSSGSIIPIASKETIEARLRQLQSSLEPMGASAALLIGWALFEAAARSILPAVFTKQQTPARLLEFLASQGYITPDEADMLRGLSHIRNELAHGRLDIDPTWENIKSLMDISQSLLQVDV